MKSPKWLLLCVVLGLNACQSMDTDSVLEDLQSWEQMFKTAPRQGVNITQGYPEPKINTASTQKAKSTAKTETKMGRINTTQCNDADDWYLDGYRVGKSFASQKSAMYQQRIHYCNGGQQFRSYWEKGFKIGMKKA